MKRLWMLLALAAALSGLPSCSFTGISAQNLISPPAATADQQSIYRLLQGTQTEITLIYPKSGQYRSAIIMCDFTGDGVEDAIGFHATADGGAQVQFLTKSGGEWAVAALFRNPASQVDRVCFGDTPGGGRAVFIGWGTTAGSTSRLATANAYLYQPDGGVKEYALGGYGEMALTDFDGDGVNELFTIDKYVPVPADTEGEEAVPAMARLYTFDTDKSLYEAASVEADNSITGYSGVAFGRLGPRDWGVVVDGTTADGSMNTQVFFMEDGRLSNYPGMVNTEGYASEYARPAAAAITARDINGDGYIEIPSAIQLPGYPEDTVLDSTSYMVEWRSQTPGNPSRVVMRALMNVRENYWFRIPYYLQGRVCALNDAERRTVTYTEVKSTDEGPLLGGTLFSIRVFTRPAWESRGENSGYIMLAEQNDSVYGINVYSRDERVLRSTEDIKKSFSLLEE